MIIYPICSSSKGNSIYVANEKGAVLIDAGASFKYICKSLNLAGFAQNSIKAIFITHEHTDHVSGLYSVTKNLNVPVFSSKPTLKKLIVKKCIFSGTRLFEINMKTANISGLRVSAFRVPHDSVDGLRYIIKCGNKKISICTDVGCVNLGLKDMFRDSDFVFLESNYDEDMLKSGSYPVTTKKRILSKYGHLSNVEASGFINELIDCGVKRFMLGHLSQNNNTPQIALKTVISYLTKQNKTYIKDYELVVAPAKNNGKFYEV